MTTSLSTISFNIFSPSSSTGSGQSFLQSLSPSDPITDQTLALGTALSQAVGNAQIKRVQGASFLAANQAVNRIHAQIASKKKEQAEKAKEAIAALEIFQKNHKVNKTA